ncbi:MAG: hydrogenase expression/formation protein HypE [Candidatus Omnitrophota bacterium]
MGDRITLAHGNGGLLTHELVDVMKREFSNRILDELADAAEMKVGKSRLAFSTDSYVIKPLFFPGGDIGKLAVYGTVNDISMKGARPLFLSLGFILEEGLGLDVLKRITRSVGLAAERSGVKIVTGDIKVVEKGAADGVFINTAGIGVIERPGVSISGRARPGDCIVINGTIAEHGMAVLNAREKLGFSSAIKSDCRNLNFVAERCLAVCGSIGCMRDLTRGGLATALNEIAAASNLGIEIDEKSVPVRRDVRALCDVLGFDPLYVANEGKFIAFAGEGDARKVARAMGRPSAVIGRVTRAHRRQVYLRTRAGADRILPALETDQLPRIC